MPNIEILGRLGPSDLLRAIESSNARKRERESSADGFRESAAAS
jgi:hypothetical protein